MSAEPIAPVRALAIEGEGEGEQRRIRFADLCEETTGFGEIEWRTFRDLLVRPCAALEVR